MKLDKQIEARKLRQEGLAINQIASVLEVSPSSVSYWVRQVKLSAEQITKLQNQNPIFNRSLASGEARSRLCRDRRSLFQQEGREKAKSNDSLHLMGCMLYWAEGGKSQEKLTFVNSDPNMIALFANFMRNSLGISNTEIALSVNVYLTNNLTISEIENFWFQKTSLDKSRLRKHTINDIPNSSQSLKKNKLIYGVCRLCVSNVKYIQHIYGAIQEYSGYNNPKFLDKTYVPVD